ncbi:aspartyl/asparaginyl beta-hydroxylase domain-containing protein [Kribbella sp. NPDC051770]|uniref:aspartyl/asparaginyl beta-hydroxylase domain-containing protein n=1 Tax=Kribbella sp. NPDC051770 TaxID=3155413 RepID=UPI003436B3AD
MGSRSPIGDQPFFSADVFAWVPRLEQHWTEIRAELDDLLVHRSALPNFQDISARQRKLSDDDNWKTFFFAGYGLQMDKNRELCPRTAALLDEVPGLETAFFSILGPGKHLPEHRGPYKGVVRYHLGLKIPEPASACGIRVGGITAHWQEGSSLVFDDTYPHEAWNKTGEDRVVLFVDVVRPLTFPYSLLNNLLLRAIARSSFIQDAKNAHDAWEKRFEALKDGHTAG